MLRKLAALVDDARLPRAAKNERRHDRRIRPQTSTDHGPSAVITACAEWLCRAQDRSASADHGVARDFSLINGWATSYPETTGYIVPTMLTLAQFLDRNTYAERARRMLDWLVSIQLPGGGFQGGKIDAPRIVPVTFNTGQILLGLAAGSAILGDQFREPMIRAADWLRDSQDADGAWRKHPTPFAEAGEKAYETHVSWGLFEADRVAPGHGYLEAGLRQVDWALTKQQPNGWVADCCLTTPSMPLTHTLGYYLKGVVEAHRASSEQRYLSCATLMAQGIVSAMRADGALPGRIDSNWTGAASWSCLTGNVQIADSLFYLGRELDDSSLIENGKRLNAFVRRTIMLDSPSEDTAGGVKGSYPVDGDYGRFEYLNWAAKFTIDSNLTELSLQ